ncbi:MAG: aminotransferase class I/II-fold pyridoxal phosphate-dependent enzyme [Bacillota bacterium]
MNTPALSYVTPQQLEFISHAQERAPIMEALSAYAGVTRFHMPGHRGGPGADPSILSLLGAQVFCNDVTGVLGLDDLHEPHGCILEAERLAAEAFGADKTFFAVNGTSSAIHAMVLASLNEGDTLIIPRNVHKSILSAIILSGVRPAFVNPSFDRYLGFAQGVEEQSVALCLAENPSAKAALLVNPTYYGTSMDLSPVADLLHEEGVVLLVDEAHGPHFRFHPRLPKPALDAGADAVAQGAHKVLGALTQASMLHVKGTRIDSARMKAMFQFLTTTSPSYLLMASLDAARRHMAMHGRELLDYAIDLAERLRAAVNDMNGLYSFGEEALGRPGAEFLDPTKVNITVRELGITGYQAEKFLRYECGIQVEMSDLYNVLVIVSFGNTEADIVRLLAGLRSLILAVERGYLPKDLLSAQKSIPDLPPVPKMALLPAKAVEAPYERVLLEDARDRVSAEVVTCYPPGIPILYPGEVITEDVVAYLSVVKDLAFGVNGPEDRSLHRLRVVKGV